MCESIDLVCVCVCARAVSRNQAKLQDRAMLAESQEKLLSQQLKSSQDHTKLLLQQVCARVFVVGERACVRACERHRQEERDRVR